MAQIDTTSVQEGDVIDLGKAGQYTKTPEGTYSPIVLSTNQGIDYINQDQKTLADLSGVDTRYQLRPGETNEAYNTRVKSYYSGETQTPPQQTNVGKIKYTNLDGVTKELSGDTITPEAVQALLNQGFYSIESSGDVPSWANTGDIETGRALAKANLDFANAQKDLDEVRGQLNSFTETDSRLQGIINAINNLWEARKTDMVNVNTRRIASLNTLGVRLGGRYTGGMFGGIVTEEERQSVTRIAELEAKKQEAISSAKESARTKNWQVYSEQVRLAEKAYTEKQDALKELNKNIVENNKKAKEQLVQSSRDNAVAGLIEQGITDPLQILDFLNYDDSGEQTGDFTIKEVTDVIEDIKNATKATNLPSDIAEWKTLIDMGQLSEGTTFLQYQGMKNRSTPTEVNAENFDRIKLEAAQLFNINKEKNADKMVDPNLYYDMRQKVPAQYRDDFDRTFMNLLSDESKSRFGISGQTSVDSILNSFLSG